jgi:hypothetical protein
MGTKSGDFAQRTFNSIQIPRRLRGAGEKSHNVSNKWDSSLHRNDNNNNLPS